MKSIWNRIEEWIAEQASGVFLENGVSASDIDNAEAILGKLPSDVRASYKIHNGTNLLWLTEDGYLMPLFVPSHVPRKKQHRYNAIVKRWTLFKELLDGGGFEGPGFVSEPVGPIKTDHWNPKWIPITDNRCGDHICIDMSPAKGGKKGQVIRWDHEVGATQVIAASFTEWLENVADEMDDGGVVLDAKSGAVKRRVEEDP